MKKSDFWKNIWIPITKRLPPEDENKVILIWLYKEKRAIAIESHLARYAAIAILNKEPVSWDRIYSDWCQVGEPEKGKGHEQKRRRSRRNKV